MNFTVTSVSNASKARLGRLVVTRNYNLDSEASPSSVALETPAFVPNTSRGHIPHLSRGNAESLPLEAVHVALEHFLDQEFPAFLSAPYSLSRYLGFRRSDSTASDPLIFLGLRDPANAEEIVATVPNGAVIRTHRGFRQVPVQKFLEVALPKSPDLLIATPDEPLHLNPSRKRLIKGINKSLDWLKQTVQTIQSDQTPAKPALFATLVGSTVPAARSHFADRIRDEEVPGCNLPALDDCIEGYAIPLNHLRAASKAGESPPRVDMATLLSASLAGLPEEKPRLVYSPQGPHEVLDLIQMGVDLLVDSWTSTISGLGIALDFNFPPPHPGTGPKRPIAHNLFDPRYAECMEPLSASSLTATAERSYQKAYLHHLLHTHEMGAHVILSLHNHAVMLNMLRVVRDSLQKEGSLKELADAFTAAYDDGAVIFEQALRDHGHVKQSRGKGRNDKQNGSSPFPSNAACNQNPS